MEILHDVRSSRLADAELRAIGRSLGSRLRSEQDMTRRRSTRQRIIAAALVRVLRRLCDDRRTVRERRDHAGGPGTVSPDASGRRALVSTSISGCMATRCSRATPRAFRSSVAAIASACATSERGAASSPSSTQTPTSSRRASSPIPSLVNGQFLPFYFSSFQQIQQVTDLFVQADGDRAGNERPDDSTALRRPQRNVSERRRSRLASPLRAMRSATRILASIRPTGPSEHDAAGRDPARRRLHLAGTYRPKLQRFLNNTQQANGELILSLPLDGEGRTIGYSKQQNSVAVGFPDSSGRPAIEAMYVLAHEIVNAITTTAINDNITPAEQRSGAARALRGERQRARGRRFCCSGPRRSSRPGYMRYYLGVAAGSRRRVPMLVVALHRRPSRFRMQFATPSLANSRSCSAESEPAPRRIFCRMAGDSNLPAPNPPSGLDRGALERVLARAAELQSGSGEPEEVLSEEQILELGKEVGLSAQHLRQALAEERTRVALPPDEGGLSAKLLGGARVGASRTVPGKPRDVLEAIDVWMQRQECLQVKRQFADRIVWEARRDLSAPFDAR